MTDFFADLERELRGAHARRPKPVVPVRAIAVTASVLIAVAVALSTLAPGGEQEVAQQPPPVQEGWTAYPAPDHPACAVIDHTRTVDAPMPDALLERFAVLRSGKAPAEPVDVSIPEARVIYGAGVRVYDPGPATDPVAVLPVGLGCAGRRGDLGMCIVRLVDERPRPHACAAVAEDDFIVSLVEPVRDGVARYGVLASDSAIDRVEVRGGALGGSMRTFEKNLIEGRRVVESAGEVSIGLNDETAIIPLNCAGQPDMKALERRLAIFREPPAKGVKPFSGALPEGWHRIFLLQARVVDFPGEERYVVFPAGDVTCGTGVCLVREGDDEAACGHVRDGVVAQLVTDLGGGEYAVGAILSDGVDKVILRHPDGSGAEELTAPAPSLTVWYSRIETARPEEIEVVAGS